MDADSIDAPPFGHGIRAGDYVAGRYQVVRELGAGGMGQVLEVAHVELGKHFALKLVRPDRWDATLEARFRREAKALGRVSSSRVVQITDFGVDAERGPFYVMELIDGVALDSLIEQGGVQSVQHGLEIGLGIARALADVHEAGLVHRDVKPGNIGICAKGPVEVRLLDFGLATGLEGPLSSRITETQKVVGSMPYMAPEQFNGASPAVTMDLWALGIVLYEMWTGRLPFDAPTAASLIHQILSAPVPQIAGLPAPHSALLARLLTREPQARVQTAAEAVELLELVAAGQPLEAPVPAPMLATAATVESESIRPARAESPPSGGTAAAPPPPQERRSAILLLGAALGVAGLLALVGAMAWFAGRSSSTGDEALEHLTEVHDATEATESPETEPTEATEGPSATPEAAALPGMPQATEVAESRGADEEIQAEQEPAPDDREQQPPVARSERSRRRHARMRREPAREPAPPAEEPAVSERPEESWNGGVIERVTP